MTRLKDSGVYWLGEVADDFDIVPSTIVFNERREKNLEDDVHLTPSQKYGVLPQDEYQEITGGKVMQKLSDSDMKHVEPDDFVIHLRSFQGGIEWSQIRGKVSTAYTVLEPRDGVFTGYWRYFLKSAPFIEGMASSTDQLRDGQTINYARFSRLKLLRPPLETQRRIADYLDKEISEMDALIEEFEGLKLDLENRAIPFAKRYLDELEDARAGLTHLGLHASFIGGSGFNERYQGVAGEELPFYKVGSLSTMDSRAIVHDLSNTVSRETAQEIGARVVPAGSILLAKVGEAMRLNRFGINSVDCCIDNNMLSVQPDLTILDTDYLRLALTQLPIDVLVNSGPVPSLNTSAFKAFKFPLPDLDTQRGVATSWQREIEKSDALIEESTRLIENLKARKTALITEVVTGRKEV
ncbi:hypothetical protein HMPREF2656_00195 [Corynebacterium sp. HMSC034B08]|uniref:restriction endonuclease subunit S n=1 Tax=Corynebacterium sp. HMSC034B08 TaxID=1715135 RepID=UPI0008AA1D27|nr:restriction endonuclease subunit S [Corynebacterium sp. HMSC034B08]OHO30194.1 hypothetical protein HMPREF2656_00195 [Corynebacterium sp. HMSC034B08]